MSVSIIGIIVLVSLVAVVIGVVIGLVALVMKGMHHPDVEASSETVPCRGCQQLIPLSAELCPSCGAKQS